MATSRKYAGLLPDLDEDRDLFETPELTEDTSTRPAGSDILEDEEDEDETTDEDEEGASGVRRHRIDADLARSHFHSSRVDARRTNFSDRLDSKRKSYRITSRREGKPGTENENEDLDDLSPKDSLKRKIAMLLREAEELKAEAQRQQESTDKETERPDGETLQQLNNAISIMETLGSSAGTLGAEARLAKQLSEATRPAATGEQPSTQDRQAPTYTLSYQPSFDDNHALSLAASFDSRLKELESALGLTSIPLPTQSDRAPKPLLPTLDNLEKQIELLSSTTPSTLDSMSKRIRQLSDEAERLDEKRKAAKQSYTDMRAAAADASATGIAPKNGGGTSSSTSLLEDAETESKIAALYSTLPTIESLAPTLPMVLERLKSLRLLHADAAEAASRIDQVEEQSKEMREDISQWRQGLVKLEETVTASEETTKQNMAVVEKWIQDLESRAGKIKTKK